MSGSVASRSLLNFKFDFSFFQKCMNNWMCMRINVRVVVFFFLFFFSLAPDQCSPAWLQLSCNYTAVCDVRLLKRSNTVSILSWGIDLRGLIRRHERSPIVFFLFYFMRVFLSSSVLCFISRMGNKPVKCHWHSEVIIEQRTAGGTSRGGETSMRASKQERQKRKERMTSKK